MSIAAGRQYSVAFDNVATTTTCDFLELNPAVDKPCRLVAIDIGQTTREGDANEAILRWSIRRFTGATITSGSGGTAPTPSPLAAADAAAGAGAEVMNTTIATTSGTNTLLHASTFNVRTGLLWVPPPNIYPWVVDNSGNAVLLVRLEEAPPASVNFSGTLYFEEFG